MVKKIKIWFYQKVGNFLFDKLEFCEEHQIQFWFNAGMSLDKYCVERDYYLV